MQNLQRSFNIGFRVTEHEKDVIKQKMEMLRTNNLNAFCRKMVLDGYMLNVDVNELSECTALLRNIGNNINQIARRVNQTGSIYAEDLQNILARLDEIWAQQNKIIRVFAGLVELGGK